MSDFHEQQFDLLMRVVHHIHEWARDDEQKQQREETDASRKNDAASTHFRTLDGELRAGVARENKAEAARRASKKQFDDKVVNDNAESNWPPRPSGPVR